MSHHSFTFTVRKGKQPPRFEEVVKGFLRVVRNRAYGDSARRAHRLGAVHLGVWCQRRSIRPEQLDDVGVDRFVRHLPHCRCPIRRVGGYSSHKGTFRDARAARAVLHYLRALGVAQGPPPLPRFVQEYAAWLRGRGLCERSVDEYVGRAMRLVKALGAEPTAFRPRDLRRFMIRWTRSREYAISTKKWMNVVLRSFVSYLVVTGKCASALVEALPGFSAKPTEAFKDLLDGFSRVLRARGYSAHVRRSHRLGGDHLGVWCQRRRVAPEDLHDALIDRFVRHLPRCRCPIRRQRGYAAQKGKFRDARAGWAVLRYLRSVGVARPATHPPVPQVVNGFKAWLRNRELSDLTVNRYVDLAAHLVRALGPDPATYRPRELRLFVMKEARSGMRAIKTTKWRLTAFRSFLQYLVVHGKCADSLVDALPQVADWRLSSVPRYLSPEDVERVIATADSTSPVGMRDRAVLLLLARLGLRAGEVARLQLTDLDWGKSRLRIIGSKNGVVTWLPMPPDVGRAIGLYLAKGRPETADEHVFIRVRAPFVRGCQTGMISQIVCTALRAAKVHSPIQGAYVFRHSIATKLLRGGWTVDAIGALLRHRHYETTLVYAKVDLNALRLVVQSWPEEARKH